MFSGSLPGFTTLEQHLETTPAILVLFLTAPDDIYAKRNPQSAILMLKAPKSLQSFRNQKMPLADLEAYILTTLFRRAAKNQGRTCII